MLTENPEQMMHTLEFRTCSKGENNTKEFPCSGDCKPVPLLSADISDDKAGGSENDFLKNDTNYKYYKTAKTGFPPSFASSWIKAPSG